MDTYVLRDLNDATVGTFGDHDFRDFRDVINWLIFKQREFNPFDALGIDNIDDLIDELADEDGYFSEDKAMELCMDKFDGINEADLEEDEYNAAMDHKRAALAGE